MSDRPSVVLTRCPICLVDPYWHYARNATRKRERECFIFGGCSHALKIGAGLVLDDPKDWRAMEAKWTAFVDSTIAETTKHWTDAQRATFRARLEGKSTLPGATEPINFPPDSPAQQEQRTNEKTE